MRTIAQGLDVGIKWPNDIYVNRTTKIGGIIIQSSSFRSKFDITIGAHARCGGPAACLCVADRNARPAAAAAAAAAGVGLNVTNSAPTTCLADLARAAAAATAAAAAGGGGGGGGPSDTAAPPAGAAHAGISREAVLASVLNEMESLLVLFAACGFAPMGTEYARRWLHTDQRVRVVDRAGGAEHACVIRGARPRGGVCARAQPTARTTTSHDPPGLTEHGALLGVGDDGARYELQPDGNSFDFLAGLVAQKLPPRGAA